MAIEQLTTAHRLESDGLLRPSVPTRSSVQMFLALAGSWATDRGRNLTRILDTRDRLLRNGESRRYSV